MLPNPPRSKETSTTFAKAEELFLEFAEQNCECSVLHRQEAPKTKGRDVLVYEVRLRSPK
jgi:hypothetical protein